MRHARPPTRESRIGSIRHTLERDHFPRIQMMLIVMLTGLVGLLASFVLLHAGVLGMGKRYLFSMAAAYIMFLFILWIWLRWRWEDADGGNLSDLAEVDGTSPSSPSCSGHGGSFDGGGASANYADSSSVTQNLGDGVGDALGGADDAAIPLAVLLLALAVVFSSLFVVWSAPLLFAELLVDGVLSAGLYNRLRGLERRHWLETALRRTALPFVLTAAVVSGAGWWMGHYAPGAHTLAQVLDYQSAEPRK